MRKTRMRTLGLPASSNSNPWRARTGQVGNGEYTDEAHQRKRGKGPLAHREVVGMVEEDGGRCRQRILAVSCEEDGVDSEA
jgi:hypothetical protein